ncbi:MAG TPA: MFS transporter [Vicinamibacterales bacterium]|nr:MFS transporter [Vicinamibacterales bacterium]HPK71774.1 MFS transporter [Vicinamibacterales bacterium]
MMSPSALQRATLTVAVLTSFMTPFMGAAVNLALPRLAAELGLDAVMLSWIATAYILAAVVFLLPFGRLADIHGRRRVFLSGLTCFLAGSVVAALARTGGMLVAARVIQGMGGGMVFGTATAMLISVYPRTERGRVLGWSVASVYLGLSLGPPAGGWIVGQFGWRAIFWTNACLCACSLGVTLRHLRAEWKEAEGEAFDVAGAVAYGLSVVALMLGLAVLPSIRGGALLALAVAGIGLFVRWEARSASPLLDVRLLRENRVFAFSNLAALINYAATFAVGFVLSLHLQYVKGLTPQQAGLVLMSQPVMQALFSPLAGRLSDRVEPRLLASAGMALTAAGLASLSFLGAGTSLAHVGASLFVLGVGFGLFSSPNTNAIMGSVDRRQYGLASAVLSTMRMLGQMFSMGMAALVIAVFVGRAAIGPSNQDAFVRGARLLLGAFAALSAFGVFASLSRGTIHTSRRG